MTAGGAGREVGNYRTCRLAQQAPLIDFSLCMMYSVPVQECSAYSTPFDLSRVVCSAGERSHYE